MLSEIKSTTDAKMRKSIESLQQEFSKLRTGRAHPSLLDGIQVEYYGQATTLNQVANIAVQDARTLSVTPYEKNMVDKVDKAIRNAGLGLNPVTAGQVIRIPLPPLTEERRKALAKQMRQIAEDAKITVRNIRRDANNHSKKMLKAKEVSEDDDRVFHEAVQKLTDKYIAEIETLSQEKETSLMQI